MVMFCFIVLLSDASSIPTVPSLGAGWIVGDASRIALSKTLYPEICI